MSLKAEQAAAIEALFRENFEPLYRCANRMLRSPPLAEEAVQEAFLIAVTKYACSPSRRRTRTRASLPI